MSKLPLFQLTPPPSPYPSHHLAPPSRTRPFQLSRTHLGWALRLLLLATFVWVWMVFVPRFSTGLGVSTAECERGRPWDTRIAQETPRPVVDWRRETFLFGELAAGSEVRLVMAGAYTDGTLAITRALEDDGTGEGWIEVLSSWGDDGELMQEVDLVWDAVLLGSARKVGLTVVTPSSNFSHRDLRFNVTLALPSTPLSVLNISSGALAVFSALSTEPLPIAHVLLSTTNASADLAIATTGDIELRTARSWVQGELWGENVRVEGRNSTFLGEVRSSNATVLSSSNGDITARLSVGGALDVMTTEGCVDLDVALLPPPLDVAARYAVNVTSTNGAVWVNYTSQPASSYLDSSIATTRRSARVLLHEEFEGHVVGETINGKALLQQIFAVPAPPPSQRIRHSRYTPPARYSGVTVEGDVWYGDAPFESDGDTAVVTGSSARGASTVSSTEGGNVQTWYS